MTPHPTDLPEKIETERLTLHKPDVRFAEQLHTAILDGYDDFVTWLSWSHTPPTLEEVKAECRQQHDTFISREYIRYIIVEKATEKVVGRCAFPSFQADWQIPQFGIAYFIRKSAQRKGFATEAVGAMTRLAFEKLHAKKVVIYCDIDNAASIKIPEKLNFTLDCTKKGGWPKANGELADLHTYSLSSKDKLPS